LHHSINNLRAMGEFCNQAQAALTAYYARSRT
jgi:hypothetical protein